MVTVKELLIDRLLKIQTESKVRVVAWPGLAGSAAALTSMSCKDIVVRPTTVLGAATRIHPDGKAVAEGETALDKKIASVEQARRRQIAQITGRDLSIMDAMQYPEKVLWYSKKEGFRPTGCSECVALDTSESLPATLNAQELTSTGIARGTATTTKDIRTLVGLPEQSPITRIDLCDPKLQAKLAPIQAALARWDDWAKARLDEFRNKVRERIAKIEQAIQQVDALSQGTGWSDAQQQRLRTMIENCRNLPKLPASLEQRRDDTPWMACKRACYEHALSEFQLAVAAGAARPAGGGRTLVDLAGAKTHLTEGYNSLVRLLNGCPDG